MAFRNKNIALVLLILSTVFVADLRAQDRDVSQQNLSSIHIDDLSDDQIVQFMNGAQLRGLSENELEQAAYQRGIQPEEVAKLRARIEKITKEESHKGNVDEKGINDALRVNEKTGSRKDSFMRTNDQLFSLFNELKPKVFGASLFNSKILSFEPNLKLPPPPNYILGPDDELIIDISGISQKSYKAIVTPEGYIRLEVIGPVFVNGLTMEQATKRIVNKLSPFYAGLRSYPQTTFAQVSLGTIRSIKVTILGEATMPGSYSLPSLATAFNALYACGGPSNNGSYRSIEIIRNNKVIRQLDIYSFLMSGNQKDNIRLEDQDIIRIPPYKNRITVQGEVKRPGLYETNSNETLDNLIDFAGGYTNKSYTNRIKVIRTTNKELAVSDIELSNFHTFKPQGGDKIIVGQLLARFENRVQISGAVFRPGVYALNTSSTLSQLIKNADGLREDALLSRALLYRIKSDLSPEVLAIDLNGVISGKGADIDLRREDSLVIYSSIELREQSTVSIDGYVQKAGTYSYAENLSVQDIILLAGGLKEGASLSRVEVARRVRSMEKGGNTAEYSKIFLIDIDANLKVKEKAYADFRLEPFDVIYVRRMQSYANDLKVSVEGEVSFPGNYNISSKTERISDIIKRAGGLNPEAYAEGAYLVRNRNLSEIEKEKRLSQLKKVQRVEKTNGNLSMLSATEEALNVQEQVGINLPKALKYPGSKYDLFLQNGDRIKIPVLLQTVKLGGEVLYPISIRYEKGKTLRNYINSAGGFNGSALKRRTYVIYANGSVKGTKRTLFVNNYPQVRPGAEVYVPAKVIKPNNTQQTLALTSGLASLALILVTLINTLNN